MNGNSKTGKIALDYIIGKCRADKATKGKPSTFGVSGWSAWISLNPKKVEVLHILPAVPSQKTCYHFPVVECTGKDLRIAERDGLAYCHIVDPKQPTSKPASRPPQQPDRRRSEPQRSSARIH